MACRKVDRAIFQSDLVVGCEELATVDDQLGVEW
jgi:hypothetical protein